MGGSEGGNQAYTVGAATAGYSAGNLHIPGNELSWEDSSFTYLSNLASPFEILVEACDGASGYENKLDSAVPRAR